MHKLCIRYQLEFLRYVLDGGTADVDQLRALATYDDAIPLHSVGHLQSEGDSVVNQDVYIRRLHCAASAMEGPRPFPGRIFGAAQIDYDTLAKRGNLGYYERSVRNFFSPGPNLRRWAEQSGLLSTVDEALRADSRIVPHRPNKRNWHQQW